jgi:hypothetical protein
VVAQIAGVLAGEIHDRELYEALRRQGLALQVETIGFNVRAPRLAPTSLGQIVAEKRRMPTVTEIQRTVKRLDGELKQSGVSGDVTSGSFSYEQPRGDSARIRQRRLIGDRQSVATFTVAQDIGHFQAVRIRNAQARAAQAQLLARLDQAASDRSYTDSIERSAARLRAGVISVADADEAIRQTVSWAQPGSAEETEVEAIRIGLGLPTSRERAVREREASDAALRSVLDEAAAGESPTFGENLDWSPVRISDRRVRRAAFGYNAPAAQLGSDYYHQVIIELQDGTVSSDTVKRAHSDLEPHVDSVVRQHEHHERLLEEAAQLQQRGSALLRRWARR